MRPIDADALYKLFMVNPKGERIPEVDCDNFPVCVNIHDVKKAILKAPTIDPVRVIRCKDCEYSYTATYRDERRRYCDFDDEIVPDDGFCHKAVKRTTEEVRLR